MNEKSLIPAIRFAGFADAWERRKVKCVAPLQRGFDLPKAQMETGAYPVVMSNGVNGYHVDYIVKGPGVITGRSGTIGRLHYIESNFWPHNTTLWVTNFYGNIPLFIYYIYQNIGLENYKSGSGVPTLNRNDIHDITVTIPDKKEQQSISSFFKLIDDLITLHQRKHEKLLHIKKSMLDKMFPKDGELFPEVRFARYTDAWERRKLGTIGKTYTGLSGKTKEDFGHGDGRFITYMNVFSNPITSATEVEAIEKDTQQNEVKKGDILFTTSSETPEEVGMSSVCIMDCPNLYLNSFCFGYRLSLNDVDLHYLAYAFRADSFRKQITLLAQGISRYNISKSKVMELYLLLPQAQEQKRIGDFFASLDNLISLHQRKLEKLQNIKKACLEKMFV